LYIAEEGRMFIKSILILVLLLSFLDAGSTMPTKQETGAIDKTHEAVSQKVIEWSDKIDTVISSWIGDPENNEETRADGNRSGRAESEINSIDAFFKNEKFLDETESTFVRLWLDNKLQSKGPGDTNLRINAQLPLSRSRKNFKIFIEDLTLDNAKDILHNRDEEHPAPDIGIHYFVPEKYGIHSRYSLGFSGLDPFVSARYNLQFSVNEWLIEPIQSFTYSGENEFGEETTVYFDKKFQELSLFRIQVHQKSNAGTEGLEYGLALQYYWSPKKNTGCRFSQSFLGNTEYTYTAEGGETKKYSGINDYTTSFSWRESIGRKWIFYEISPGVSFQKKYGYEPNYTLRFLIDFYFGQYLSSYSKGE